MDVNVKGTVAGVFSTEIDTQKESLRLRRTEVLFRILPMALSTAALLVMLKNRQDADYFGSVSYSDIGGFRYLVYANALCAGYSLVSAALCAAVPPCPAKSCSWTFFLLDQMLTYLTLAAGTVCTEVLYLAYNGDARATWGEACTTFGTFCRKATASVAITFTAVLCYVLLSLRSTYRLFSTFEAPCTATCARRVEAAAFPLSG